MGVPLLLLLLLRLDFLLTPATPLRYLLQPKGTGSKSKSDELGSLRLKLTYIEDTVLPPACYTPLCNLLLKSPEVKVRLCRPLWIKAALTAETTSYTLSLSVSTLFRSLSLSQPISASAAHILGEVCRERYEAVLPTVRLLLHHHRFVPFVSAVASLELDNTQ